MRLDKLIYFSLSVCVGDMELRKRVVARKDSLGDDDETPDKRPRTIHAMDVRALAWPVQTRKGLGVLFGTSTGDESVNRE